MNLEALACASARYTQRSPSAGTLGGYDEESITVEYLSKTLMSVVESGSTDCGGAHPYNHYEPYTLDLLRGGYLDAARLFKGYGRGDTPHSDRFVKFLQAAAKRRPERDSEVDCTGEWPSYLALHFKAPDRVSFDISGIGHAMGVCLGPHVTLSFSPMAREAPCKPVGRLRPGARGAWFGRGGIALDGTAVLVVRGHLPLKKRLNQGQNASYPLGTATYHSSMEQTRTLRLRIKDKHAKVLVQMAREVNTVWNFNNETSHRAIRERHQWLSGYDLGLKEAAVASDGQRVEGRFYRKLQAKLGIAQRARKKARVRAIHAKIANQRKDMLHKFSTQLVKQHGAIFVGNVASAQMIKTKMAKSTLDAGWAMLKTMLEYKSHQAGIVFEEVNEAYSTQTCSCCGNIPTSSPKGRAGLGIRGWTCCHCGATHDRDIHAARNILAAGSCRLAGGIPVL